MRFRLAWVRERWIETQLIPVGGVFPRREAKRKLCAVEGCSTMAAKWGLCVKHGGYTRCREEGCEKVAHAGGLCRAHGGR